MTSQSSLSDMAETNDGSPHLRRLTGAERLIGIGFRCWLAGFDRGDIHCWIIGWEHFATILGAQRARVVAPELANWVRTLFAHATRPIQICAMECKLFPPDGRAGFCQDECLAVAIVAASQHPECPALRACAMALTGADAMAVEEVLEASRKFARTLANAGIVLEKAGLQ